MSRRFLSHDMRQRLIWLSIWQQETWSTTKNLSNKMVITSASGHAKNYSSVKTTMKMQTLLIHHTSWHHGATHLMQIYCIGLLRKSKGFAGLTCIFGQTALGGSLYPKKDGALFRSSFWILWITASTRTQLVRSSQSLLRCSQPPRPSSR